MTPLPAAKALEAYFLEARCKILDLAAILDRIGRSADTASVGLDLEGFRSGCLNVLVSNENKRLFLS
jgi:hypothetical protein